MSQTNWKVSKKSANGTSFIMPLGICAADLIAAFGECPADIHPSNDYSESLHVENDNEPGLVYTIYTRYGEWRIGGHDNGKHAGDLQRFILEKSYSKFESNPTDWNKSNIKY
jgi:hypothetical protein